MGTWWNFINLGVSYDFLRVGHMNKSDKDEIEKSVAMSPLLRKGGVHKHSKSGLRADSKRETLDAIRDWRESLEEECLETTERSQSNFGDDFLKSPLL